MSDTTETTTKTVSKKTRMHFDTQEGRLTWHKDKCPCKSKPQAVSAKLQGRRDTFDASQTKTNGGFHRPGSQNRNK